MHYITTAAVSYLILETIRRTTAFAQNNEAKFIEIIRETSRIRQNEAVKSHKKQVAKNERRIAELDSLFKKTYEDFAAGLLNESRFRLLSGGYETEQTSLETRTAELIAELEQFDRDSFRADKFLELTRSYTDFTELTSTLLHAFVEKVVVHEADKSSGKREQQVDIYLNFIGQAAVLGEDEPYEGTEEKRAMWRDYKRNQRARNKPAEEEKIA